MKKLFCRHQFKKIRVVKEEHFPHMPSRYTWLYICEICGKEKLKKDY